MPRVFAVLSLLHLCLAGCDSQPATEADFTLARKEMVQQQLARPDRNIRSRRVLDAMATVARHEFVPAAMRPFAYQDEPLPIGYGQTISQPFVVAFMTEHLAPKPTDRVLEIGTGSGYQAAVLSLLVAEVYTIEMVEPLAQRARAALERLGYNNVKVLAGNGYQGWPEHAPFDAILVTCAPEHIPQPLIDQLKEGGRMAIPVGPSGLQQLYLRGVRNHADRRLPILFRMRPLQGAASPQTG